MSESGTRILERSGDTPAIAVRRGRIARRTDDGTIHVPLSMSSIVVGSAESADIVLVAPTVSRRHVELRIVEAGCLVRDLGSKNGTFVDGLRVVEAIATKGFALRVGEETLVVELDTDEAEVPLSRATSFGGLLGHGPAMRAIFAMLERVAKTEATVLVTGESGTGKELAARAIHDRSPRKEGPYVVFDCAAVSPTLIESQLFGHARGAFTGATESRAGCFELADGGTLVLDEIGELPLELQPKLLRALEDRTIQRIGEPKRRTVSVRFVACTNRNLAEEVRAGRFREDLYFRLSVISIRMPPLRERRDEIPRLVSHFRTRIGGDDAPELPREVLALLERHDFPGNVRELRNIVERCLTLPGSAANDLLHAGISSRPAAPESDARWSLPFHDAKGRLTDDFERAYLERLIARHNGNISEAARASGLSRQTCYRLMHKHGFRVDE